jgi:hypothetical protein
MTSLNIEMIEKGDRKPKEEGLPIQLDKVFIYEGMTEGQRTGVMLRFVDKDGDKYYALTTGRMIVNGVASAIKGAMERWADDINEP